MVCIGFLSGGTQDRSQFRRGRRAPGSHGFGAAVISTAPLAGTQFGTLHQFLYSLQSQICLLLTTAASLYDTDLRQLLMLPCTENLATAALLFGDRDANNY